MACSGHCNHCPSHPGYSGPLSAYTWADATLDTDDTIDDYDYNELRSTVISELARWGVSYSTYDPGNVDTNDIIYATDYKFIRNALEAIASFSYSYLGNSWLTDLEPIYAASTAELRNQIDYLRKSCVCDCNYSCTCDCNYCTCNCNYSCTCNCNYSDKNLKENINYM